MLSGTGKVHGQCPNGNQRTPTARNGLRLRCCYTGHVRDASSLVQRVAAQ